MYIIGICIINCKMNNLNIAKNLVHKNLYTKIAALTAGGIISSHVIYGQINCYNNLVKIESMTPIKLASNFSTYLLNDTVIGVSRSIIYAPLFPLTYSQIANAIYTGKYHHIRRFYDSEYDPQISDNKTYDKYTFDTEHIPEKKYKKVYS
jgi:hypothetical protein